MKKDQRLKGAGLRYKLCPEETNVPTLVAQNLLEHITSHQATTRAPSEGRLGFLREAGHRSDYSN